MNDYSFYCEPKLESGPYILMEELDQQKDSRGKTVRVVKIKCKVCNTEYERTLPSFLRSKRNKNCRKCTNYVNTGRPKGSGKMVRNRDVYETALVLQSTLDMTEKLGLHSEDEINKKLFEYFKRYGNNHLSRTHFNRIKRQAADRGHSFEVSYTYVMKMFIEQKGKCSYSGRDLVHYYQESGEFIGDASLDRIDPKLGYVEGNLQWIHKVFNHVKELLNDEEFKKLIKDSYHYLVSVGESI